jgi:hypothetical protein
MGGRRLPQGQPVILPGQLLLFDPFPEFCPLCHREGPLVTGRRMYERRKFCRACVPTMRRLGWKVTE